MSAPEADPAEPVPEEVMRRVAREEARAVYDEHTVTGPDGQEWSFNTLVERIGELEGGIGRRTYIKAAMALGYIAMGTAGTTAIMQVMSQPARADAFGEAGTQADPLTKLWAHAIGAGDGADAIGLDDAVTFDHEAVSSSVTIGNVTYVYFDSSVAGFTLTIPAALEARGGYVVFIDEGASAASNNVDVTSTNWTVDGVASSTIDANQVRYPLAANPNQSDWTSRIFTQSLDAREITADDLGLTDQLIYVLADTGDLLQTVDPAATSTPISDAHATSGASKVVLPPGTIQESSPVSNAADRISMVGAGVFKTFVELTSDTDDFFQVSPTGGAAHCKWDGFTIQPSTTDGSRTGGHAIDFDGVADQFDVGSLLIRQWSGAEAIGCDGSHPFSSRWESLTVEMADDNDCIRQATGQSWSIGTFAANPSGGDILGEGDGTSYSCPMGFDVMNIGGEPGEIISGTCFFSGYIGRVNYEPSTAVSNTALFNNLSNPDPAYIGPVIIQTVSGTVTLDDVFVLATNNGGKFIMQPKTGGATINNHIIDVASAPDDATNNPSYYLGPDSDVDDNSAAGAVRCLASAGTASTNP